MDGGWFNDVKEPKHEKQCWSIGTPCLSHTTGELECKIRTMISILPGTQHIGAQWTPQPWMRESQKHMESPRICEFVLFIREAMCFFLKMALQIHEDFLPPYTISAKTVIQIASEFTIYVIVIVIVIIIIIVIIISFIIIIFLIIIFLIYVLKSSHLTQEPSLPPVLRKSHGFLLPALGGVRPGAQSPPRQHRGFADPGRVLRSVAVVVVVVVVVVAVVLEVLRSKTTKFNHLRR